MMSEFYVDLLKLVLKYNLKLEYDWDLDWHVVAEDSTYISIPTVVPLELGITRTDAPKNIEQAIRVYLGE